MPLVKFKIAIDTAKFSQRTSQFCVGLILISCNFVAGCGDDGYKQSHSQNGHSGYDSGRKSTTIGDTMVYGSGNAPKSTSASLSADGNPLDKNADHNKIIQGDIFFKLDWIRGMVETGTIPGDMQTGLNECRKLLATVKKDNATQIMTEIVKLYQDGLGIRREESDMRNAGVAVNSLKWSLGALQFESDLASTSQLGRSASQIVASNHKGEELAKQFQIKHHASPTEAMWRLFKSADPKVLSIGKLLGLSSTTSLDGKDPFSADNFDTDKPENNPFLREP